MTIPQEPPDYHVYSLVFFRRDSFEYFRAAASYYESLLQRDIDAVTEDTDLRTIVSDQVLESYPVAEELRQVKRLREWFDDVIGKWGEGTWHYSVSITHGSVRLIKSITFLYLEHLRGRRQVLAARPFVSRALLEMVDQELARFDEKCHIGVFQNASPYPLLFDDIPRVVGMDTERSTIESTVYAATDLLPIFHDTIEVRDPELRKRCLDLFAQFRDDGAHERLDTVVNEATRILEDRLRSLSNAPVTCVGVDLAKYAFGSATAPLVVSNVSSEQESAHLLFRGVFGFIRNSVHHKLVTSLQPERVLQIVGMIDYLISVAEAAGQGSIDSPKSSV